MIEATPKMQPLPFERVHSSRVPGRSTPRAWVRGGEPLAPLALSLWLLLFPLSMAGCGGPFLMFPGGALDGELARTPVRDWSFASDRFVDLELRPEDPYSVELNYLVREGRLYVDPAEGRRWLEMLREQPHARVRFGNTLYPVEARLVAEPVAGDESGEREGEFAGFDADRFIYELVWRTPSADASQR